MSKPKNKRLKSGAWLWLKRGQVPRDAEDVRLGINRIAAELADEFAGVGKELTPSQLILIDRVASLLGFAKLIERAAMREGVIVVEDGKQRLSPGLSGFYVAASNAVAKAMKILAEISPNRGAGDKPLDLSAYLKSRETNSTST